MLCIKAVSPDNYPEGWSYDPETQLLTIGEGEFAPVSSEVWNYSMSRISGREVMAGPPEAEPVRATIVTS